MASGSKKICKHKLVGGDGRELPDFLPLLKTRVEQRIAAPVKLAAIHESDSMVSGPFAKGQVGGNDDGSALVQPADQMEDRLSAGRSEGQIAELVEPTKSRRVR